MAQLAGGGPADPADPAGPARAARPTSLRGGAVFDAVPAEVPRARRVLVAALRRWHVHEDDVHTAQLVAGELLSNAVRYGSGPTMDLDVRLDAESIHVAVRNRHARPRRLSRANGSAVSGASLGPRALPEQRRAPAPSAWAGFDDSMPTDAAPEESLWDLSVWERECGRGLRLVEALALEWGSRPLAGELLVWATISRGDPEDAGS
ncbi:ATP-binding protein [Embleya sp. NPDC020886]|uniref:ATP-binding protein n=1 Tax=Embleya sp. NPDC020886 TaxID=3363980 RepID=UPI0037ACCF50